MASVSANDLVVHKWATIVSWVLAAFVSIRYFVGRSPSDSHNPYHVADTPFSGNIIVTLVYWLVLFFLQISFVVQIFVPAAESASALTPSRTTITKQIAWHFTGFNLGVFAWTLLFVKKHFFWSELVLLANFGNITYLYFAHKTYRIRPLSTWILIHWPTVALPWSWLMFAVFWNGAVLFHVHKFVGRIIANILVWLFLFVPTFFIAVFNDWGIGLSSSALMFGLGLNQIFTKTFALQWIFAFVISGLLFVLSIAAAATGKITKETTAEEGAPLLDGN
ncbi:hypothetical protein C7M61_001293 [Candidozyma pseudohaemuli]|uniref:DUF1774 domain-containing protein n=1 Tax=Candidozyma pseudohaemuli TaxID=418784 RepID=A0A2P7Z076_9ASCO|nr:hypothetical protein C7M61_001293 [[Candida] pseudohaemulonii]PSK41607.1 hypothetical protein C7M61_001293 [[Candida] pseudohaemulonii]